MTEGFKVDKFHFKSDSVFQGLPEDELAFLEKKMSDRVYRKGQRVFVEGSIPTGIYYVKKGKIKKYKADWDGKESIIYVCLKGELFGYPALLSEEPYTHSAAAMEDSLIAMIPKNDFLDLLASSQILSGLLLKNLSHEFGVMVNKVTSLSMRSVRERLALRLLILKERNETTGHEKQAVEINLSREDLAGMIGTAVETLVRVLHEFKLEKLIETNGRTIKVLDIPRLIKIANFY
jgi:CRP-like cAMP-binding protein